MNILSIVAKNDQIRDIHENSHMNKRYLFQNILELAFEKKQDDLISGPSQIIQSLKLEEINSKSIGRKK